MPLFIGVHKRKEAIWRRPTLDDLNQGRELMILAEPIHSYLEEHGMALYRDQEAKAFYGHVMDPSGGDALWLSFAHWDMSHDEWSNTLIPFKEGFLVADVSSVLALDMQSN